MRSTGFVIADEPTYYAECSIYVHPKNESGEIAQEDVDAAISQAIVSAMDKVTYSDQSELVPTEPLAIADVDPDE